MYENVGHYYFLNGQKHKAESFALDQMPQACIYEVLRVKNNKIMFLDDHMERLEEGLVAGGHPLTLVKEVQRAMASLVRDHADFDCNLKIDIGDQFSRVYFVKSTYPCPRMYQEGVATTLLDFDRQDPQHKILNMAYKARIEAIKGGAYFEVLLVNKEGLVIEGSRSNLVFVYEDKLVGAPLKEILHGVTYKNVMKLARALGIGVVETGFKKSMLKEAQACFLTGTSLGVLPIQSIGDLVFESTSHGIVKSLIKAYNNDVEDK